MKKILLTSIANYQIQLFWMATVFSAVKGGDTINFASNVTGVEVYLNNVRVKLLEIQIFY